MRYILIACLITGCSAGGPMASPQVAKDRLAGFMYTTASKVGASMDEARCQSDRVRRLSDADAVRILTALENGGVIGSIPELSAISTGCLR